jgi:hypothetical protein
MGVIEKIDEKQKEAQAAENPTAEREVKGATLREIMANKGQNDLFGTYLREEGEEELALKLAKVKLDQGSLDPEDFEKLNGRRLGFLEIMEWSKNMAEVLDLDSLNRLIEASPELKMLRDLTDPERIRDAILRQLPEIAILDRERFKHMSEQAVEFSKTKNAIAEENKNIAKLCKEYGIDEKKYVEILSSGDRSQLTELVSGKIGTWKSLFMSTQKIIDKIDELDKTEVINQHLMKFNSDIKGIAGSLGATLMENETLRKSLSRGIIGEEASRFESGMPLGEVKRPKEEDVDTAFEEFMRGVPQGVDREEAVESFSRGYAEKAMKGKKGFWAKITGEFFGSMVQDMIKKK